MSHPAQVKILAAYMRGGTSRGVFLRLQDLPSAAQRPGTARGTLLMHMISNPDSYGKQIDDMGGTTSGTSKAVILSKSTRPDHDVGYLFGQVSIDKSLVDWSGNCGNLSAAVGPSAISNGLINASRISQNGVAIIRTWQANINKTIIAHIPITNGAVQEISDFELGGVTFPAVEVQLEFLDPTAEEDGDGGGAIFPTSNLVDGLEVPGVDTLKATIINADIPVILIGVETVGYTGTELQGVIDGDAKALAMFGTVHAHDAVHMGLIKNIEEAAARQRTPKMAFVAPPKDCVASNDKKVGASGVDLLVHASSTGKLYHAMMGTAAAAIDTAAAVPGTLVNLAADGGERGAVRFGHPSGTLRVGAEAKLVDGEWTVTKAIMSRGARVLMEDWMRVPGWRLTTHVK